MRGLVTGAVAFAFDVIGDLAVPCQITARVDSDFDFGSGQPVTTPRPTVNASYVETGTEVKADSNGMSILINAEGMPDLAPYDSVVIDGFSWKLDSVHKHGEYLLKLEVSRG